MIDKISITEEDKNSFSGISINPNDIADDKFDYSNVVVKKPWGYEYLIFQNEIIAIWILYLKPGAQTSMHCHPNKKTSLVVLEGKAICSTLQGDIKRNTGDGLLIEKGAFHQTKADSDSGVFVMEIESPVNKRDLVRLKDEYGRQEEGYEMVDKYSFTQNYNYLTLSDPEVYYNLNKRFGKCTITLKKIKNSDELSEIFKLDGEDVVCVLKGNLLDKKGTPVVDVGDTITINDLNSHNELVTAGTLEILIIKRIDTIIKVSDYVMSFLNEHNVKEVFFVPGSANVHLLDSLGTDEELNFTCNQTERVASMAAEAYSKLVSDFGVLIVSSGASGTNAITGVSNAWVDSTPLIILSGQATLDQDSGDSEIRQLGNKSLNIVDIVKPVTKYAVKITDPLTIRYHLEKAAYLAKEGRPGPVWIDIPVDIQGMTIDEDKLESFSPPAPDEISIEAELSEVVGLLKTAKRPVILVGNGLRLSGAVEDFLKLIDMLKIPVLTSRRGADLLPEDHPSFFGRPGAYGQRRANFVIQNSDLLISIGSRLSIPLTGRNYKAFARAAKKVIVDIDKKELEKKTVKPDVAINSSAKEFILKLSDKLKSCSFEPQYQEWLDKCRDWAAKFPPCSKALYAHKAFTNPYLFVDALSNELKDDAIIIVDGGNILNYMMQTFRFKQGQRLITSTGLELPGFSLPGSIGASVGNHRGQVICLCEDCGFQVNIQELQTIMDNKLPIKIFILKSKGSSDIRNIQKEYFSGRYVGTDNEILFGSPDLVKIGDIYKFSTQEIKSPRNLNSQIREVLNRDGPVMCEIQIDKDQERVPRIVFTVTADGKWKTKPLEDMYPFLDRQNLKENMLIKLFEED